MELHSMLVLAGDPRAGNAASTRQRHVKLTTTVGLVRRAKAMCRVSPEVVLRTLVPLRRLQKS